MKRERERVSSVRTRIKRKRNELEQVEEKYKGNNFSFKQKQTQFRHAQVALKQRTDYVHVFIQFKMCMWVYTKGVHKKRLRCVLTFKLYTGSKDKVTHTSKWTKKKERRKRSAQAGATNAFDSLHKMQFTPLVVKQQRNRKWLQRRYDDE